MAGIEMKGLEDLRRNTEKLGKAIVEECLVAANTAAAKYMKTTIKASTPTKTGTLASSVDIVKGKSKETRGGSTFAAGRLLVGPTKKKGYYGFFVDKGRRGFEITKASKKKALHFVSRGKDIFVKRVGPISARRWFERAVGAGEAGADKAGRDAFDAKLKEVIARDGVK